MTVVQKDSFDIKISIALSSGLILKILELIKIHFFTLMTGVQKKLFSILRWYSTVIGTYIQNLRIIL